MPVIKYIEELGCYMMLFKVGGKGSLFHIPAMNGTGKPEMQNNTFEWNEVTSVDGFEHMYIINRAFGTCFCHEIDFAGR